MARTTWTPPGRFSVALLSNFQGFKQKYRHSGVRRLQGAPQGSRT